MRLTLTLCLVLLSAVCFGGAVCKTLTEREKSYCLDNVKQFTKCLKLSPKYLTDKRFDVEEGDCYGLLHMKCLDIYCGYELFKETREYTYCKWWFFGCSLIVDHICGMIW